MNPFWVIVQKEVSDHLRSWRFYVLVLLMFLTCIGSLYTALNSIQTAASADDSLKTFLLLKLFTVSDGTLPPFITFVGFLGPLIGIGLGFDAINAERSRGTLSRLMAQPIYRDTILNAKFTASLIVISMLLFALGFLVMGFGILLTGYPLTPEEFVRIILFLVLSICYVAFWLNLAILFSVRFKQAATSALSSISVWLFFSVFFNMIVELIARATYPVQATSSNEIIGHQNFVMNLLRLSPSQLYSEATTTLLTPSVRSLGPLMMEQVYGAIPSPLSLDQSLLLVWSQVTGLIAVTMIVFAISYRFFMRQEIRSR